MPDPAVHQDEEAGGEGSEDPDVTFRNPGESKGGVFETYTCNNLREWE